MQQPLRWVAGVLLVALVAFGLFAAWQWLGNRTPEVNEDGRPFMLWSFESGRMSSDGTTLELDVYLPPDPACWEYDHLETEVVDHELVVSLYYLGPTPDQFCVIPCPIGTGTGAWTLEAPVDPSLVVVKDPATEPHCSEMINS